jgi:hypothetical protein
LLQQELSILGRVYQIYLSAWNSCPNQ